MKEAFWLSLGITAYAYAGYPALMALLARLRPKPWRRGPVELSVSIVMPVFNGAHVLREKLEHLCALDPARVKEIVVVSDGSTDETAGILEEMTSPRLTFIILKERAGKAEALNRGIAAATGDLLLFVDIRPRMAPGALEELIANFADPSAGCAAGELLLENSGGDAAAGAISGGYWRYEQWIRHCEAAWDSPVGVYGGFYAVRRPLVKPFPAGLILDDMFQPLSIVRQGYRCVLDRHAQVYDCWPKRVEGEFQRKVRTLAGNFQLIAAAPWILSPGNRVWIQLISHKLLRLAVPYLFLVMLASASALSGASAFWAALAAAQWLFWLVSLCSLRFSVPLIQRCAALGGALLVLNAAAVAGLYRFLFASQPLWKIWSVQPAPVEKPILRST